MSDLRKTYIRCLASLALTPTAMLSRHEKPIERDEIAEKISEEAALAFDDIEAAKKSYWRAVNIALGNGG